MKCVRYTCSCFLSCALALLFLAASRTSVSAFTVGRKVSFQPQATGRYAHGQTNDVGQKLIQDDRLDIVIFGVGDLRTHDHGGLSAALEAKSKVMPLLILDSKETLPKIPGAICHTIDTATMLSEVVSSLSERLDELNMKLHIKTGKGKGVNECLSEVIAAVKQETGELNEIYVHACDLGDADNHMGYGPLSHLSAEQLPDGVSLKKWDCNLRPRVWDDLDKDGVVDSYPEYASIYKLESTAPKMPLPEPTPLENGLLALSLPDLIQVPTYNDILSLLERGLNLNMKDPATKSRLKLDINTGLYGTHWGGLNNACFTEADVLDTVKAFVACNEDDPTFIRSTRYKNEIQCRNERSLEHASLSWMMRSKDAESGPLSTDNLIGGELMTRFLAAPLLFGTISPRFLWHAAKENANPFPIFNKPSMFKSLAESREWHRLLAARNIRKDQAYALTEGGTLGEMRYGYWRWHGFLCRYGIGMLHRVPNSGKKEGLILVHGFGASGSQWSKAILGLSNSMSSSECYGRSVDCAVPDLIGFGQSEKPPITYTQYLWESYTSAFAKEVCLNKLNFDEFVIGGNSIGGYTSMGAAADDTLCSEAKSSKRKMLSASGALGSGRCTGVVLMNSAGQINTKEDIENMLKSGDDMILQTIAEVTASDYLPACSPPPRQLARVFGNGLLWYLRPQIKSICKNLYPTNPEAVDDVLCSGILRDSLDPGAIYVMISGSKLPPPRTANELLGADFGSAKTCVADNDKIREGVWEGPVLVAQGMLDPLNDAKGRAALLGSLRTGISVVPINGGHCPHDELPDDIANAIVTWKRSTKSERGSFLARKTEASVST